MAELTVLTCTFFCILCHAIMMIASNLCTAELDGRIFI
jgi:hypothetical protein